MKRRKWTGKEKLQIVLEGMRGQVPLGVQVNMKKLSASPDLASPSSIQTASHAAPSLPFPPLIRQLQHRQIWPQPLWL